MKYCGESTLPNVMRASRSARTASGSCSGRRAQPRAAPEQHDVDDDQRAEA